MSETPDFDRIAAAWAREDRIIFGVWALALVALIAGWVTLVWR
jgi:hypothetical protein